MPVLYIKSGLDSILPYPFQFVIHYYPLIRPYTALVTNSVVKLTTYIINNNTAL
jgi:hypothetical protein